VEQILPHSRPGRTSGLEHIRPAAVVRGLTPEVPAAPFGPPVSAGKTAGTVGAALSPDVQVPPPGVSGGGEEMALLMAAPPSQGGQSSQPKARGEGLAFRFGVLPPQIVQGPQPGVQGEGPTLRFGVVPPQMVQRPQPEARGEGPAFRFGVAPPQMVQGPQPGARGEGPTLRFGVTPAGPAGQPSPELQGFVPAEGTSFPLEELTYGPVQTQEANVPPEEAAARQDTRTADSPVRWSWPPAQSNLSFSPDSPLQSGVGTRPMTTVRPIGAPPQEGGGEHIQWTAPGLGQRPAELSFRQQEPAAPASVPSPELSDRELRRAADRVYQMIEDRLRQERRRLDL